MNIRLQAQKQKQHELALEAFVANVQTANELLSKMSDFVGNHCDVNPDDINWGHAGSMSHLVNQLKEMSEFIGMGK